MSCLPSFARRPILVLGIGNLLLRDEGVGIHVIRAMRETTLPSHVELLDGATAGFDLMDFVADRKKVIVIDAVQSDSEPGTVLRMEIDMTQSCTRPVSPASLHEAGILEPRRATRLLGCPPREVILIGIRPAVLNAGTDLSPTVAAAVPRAIEQVMAECITDPGVLIHSDRTRGDIPA